MSPLSRARRSATRRVGWAAAAAALPLTGVLALPAAHASTPPTSSVTVPATVGATARTTWTGTIPVGSDPMSTCSTPGVDDQHGVTLVVPAAAAAAVNYTVTFSISWTPLVTETANDEVLTILGPTGTDVGDSDTSNTTETVVLTNPKPGTYTAVACGYVNTSAVSYTGKAVVATVAKPVGGALKTYPPVTPSGLAFSAGTPSDIQRDIGEPAVTTDRAGNIYTCGPSGFSNIADYANVSTDGGDQFHLIGTPPRGQISGGEGGGDCALATSPTTNSAGHYTLAYAGLGPLTNFSTATSADTGRTITVSPISESIPGVDRQWITFIDDKTAFLTYNQQALNKTVQKSTDGGLTYAPGGVVAANESGRIGQIRSFTPAGKPVATGSVVYFPYSNGTQVKLAVSQNSGATFSTCVAVDAKVSPDAGFVGADNDNAGNVYVTYSEAGGGHDTYLVAIPAAHFLRCAGGAALATGPKIRMNRAGVATTVMPWVAAGGQPGRVAVAYYGSTSTGDPNLGSFKGAWNVYVDQTLDALSPSPHVDQSKVTTFPMHYDSICLNGLGCDLSVPAGDRTLVDYFTMEYNRGTGRLTLVWADAAKKPDEASGHVSAPMTAVQIAGPSNGGGSVAPHRGVVQTSVTDPTGDALSQYSTVLARTQSSVNCPALDLTGVSATVLADHTVRFTLKVSDLSAGALQQAMTANDATSLEYLVRWQNGFQPAAVDAHYTPGTGWTVGFDPYLTDRTAGGTIEKYPGAVTLPDSAIIDTAHNTLTFTVPASLMTALSPPQGLTGRPVEQKLYPGARIPSVYGATLADVVTPVTVTNPATGATTTSTQSYLYPVDNAATFDVIVPGSRPAPVVSRVTGTGAGAVAAGGSGTAAASGGTSSQLATTGGLGAPGLAVGAALLALGGAVVARRRRTGQAG